MWRRIAPRPLYPKGLRILRHITAKGTYPPPELPGFPGTTDLSATLPGPACPSRAAGWRVRATARASRVAPVSLLHACCRQYPGGDARCSRRSLPGRWLPSPKQRRVGLRIMLFEACSAFTRVAACVLAEPPKRRPFTSECFSPCRYLHDPLRRLPAGATVSRAGFAPAGSQCLSKPIFWSPARPEAFSSHFRHPSAAPLTKKCSSLAKLVM